MSAATVDYQQVLTERLLDFRYDPLGAVLYGFPWGEGELAGIAGPRKWQCEELTRLGAHLRDPNTRFKPYLAAISSGHGPGKSALGAFLSWWALSTFPDTRAKIMANTKLQLDTKTQPEMAHWFRLALNSEWFEVNVTSIKVRDQEHRQSWRADFEPWSEDNAQATAGLHNARKRVLLIFDEASEIADIIMDTAHGAMTDAETEIICFALGNPTRNVGWFYEAVFGNRRNRWHHRVIDSRDVEGVNLEEIGEWLKACDNNEDADYFRVRARGLPPRAGSGQFIDLDRIHQAQRREARCLPDDPLVAGADFAWGGEDDNVVRFRKGFDARTLPPLKIKGEFTRDPAVMTQKLNDTLNQEYEIGGVRQKLDMLFLDSAGIAAPVHARLQALGHKNLMLVNFGADSPTQACAYFRDFMWNEMREWLLQGAIDKDSGLEADLSGPLLVSDLKQRVKLESKELMRKRQKKLGKAGDSPDDGDALALTFAMKLAPKPAIKLKRQEHRYDGLGWMR